MRPTIWLIGLALATSCSSRDESLGETRRAPQPTIEPNPDPDPQPDPEPDPNPDPQPDPDPDPSPTLLPCEDFAKHLPAGECMKMIECHREVLTGAGYECEGDAVCCNQPAPGCSRDCCGPDCEAMSQGGQGNAGAAGAGGNP